MGGGTWHSGDYRSISGAPSGLKCTRLHVAQLRPRRAGIMRFESCRAHVRFDRQTGVLSVRQRSLTRLSIETRRKNTMIRSEEATLST